MKLHKLSMLLGFLIAMTFACAPIESQTGPNGEYIPSKAEVMLANIQETLKTVQTVSAITAGVAPVTAPVTGPVSGSAGILGTLAGLAGMWLMNRNKSKLKLENESLVDQVDKYATTTKELVAGVGEFMKGNPIQADKKSPGTLAATLTSVMGGLAKMTVREEKAAIIKDAA